MTAPLSRHVTIVNRRGLHARASARFVKCAAGFDAAVQVIKDGHSVDGTSIMGLITLAVAPGGTIELTAEGPEAEAAVEALAKLVESGFGEED
jgi:phosphocarrier protein